MSKSHKYTIVGNQTANILDDMEHPFYYRSECFGFGERQVGKGVRICIIDTGVPRHKDLISVAGGVDLSDVSVTSRDTVGHATMLSGIIGACNPDTLVGIAPAAELIYAKAVNSYGSCQYNALIASVLWAIIKKSDIILMSLGSSTDYSVFHDAIKKAHGHNVAVIAAASQDGQSLAYPARYPEVFAVGVGKRTKRKSRKPDDPNLSVPIEEYYTTYLGHTYVKSYGASLAAALTAGLAALVIEKRTLLGEESIPVDSIYEELSFLKYKAR